MDFNTSRARRIPFLPDGWRLVRTGLLCKLAGQYAVEDYWFDACRWMGRKFFDCDTAATGGLAAAPKHGHDPHGRRHQFNAWLDLITEKTSDRSRSNRKLVSTTVENFQTRRRSRIVDTLDAVQGRQAGRQGCQIAPIMIYGDDGRCRNEEGIAYLVHGRTGGGAPPRARQQWQE